MKKILGSVGMLALVGALVWGATGAFFSDTETSTGNTFTAGAIDLKIDSEATYNGDVVPSATWTLKDLVPTSDKFFNFGDIKPGDEGENTISIHVLNNDAWVCAAVTNLQSDDNGLTEPEGDVDVTDGPGNGELDDEMIWKIWRDDGTGGGVAGNNIQDGTEPTLASGSPSAGVLPLYDSTTATGPLTAATTGYVGVAWELPATSGNETQTDSLKADISFYTVQSRNNLQFQCSDWTPSEQGGEQGPKVGAKLSAYVAPTACSVTVSGAGSIQTAIDAASAGQTVCVDNTYDMAGDNSPIQVNKDITLAATTQGVDLDVPVVLAADGVTVTGFTGSIGAILGQQAAFYIVNGSDNFEVSYNEVNGSGVGAGVMTEYNATYASGLIANNVLGGATQGMYLNPFTGGTITVEYNDIKNNVAGIGGLNGAIVRYNEFTHTVAGSEAIGIDATFDSNVATVNFNNFLNSTKYNDYGATATPDAENNFWSTSGVSQTTGGVDFTPETVVQYAHN